MDLGAGQGQLSIFLQSTHPTCKVVGVEYSAEGVRRAVEAATATGSSAQFVQCDLLEPLDGVPSVGAGAGFAVCSEVLEHVDEPEVLIRNASAYMAPGCRLVVTVPGGPRSALDRHIGHRQHFTAGELSTILRRAGYRVERVYRAGFPTFNLYRLAVVLRGERLIGDLAGPEADSGGRVGQAAFRLFDSLLPWSLDDFPFGWQIAAVATFPG